MGKQASIDTNGCYILTCDVGDKVEIFRNIGLKTPDYNHSFYTDFKSGLEDRIHTIYPDAEIKSLFFRDIEEKIWKEALRVRALNKDSMIASTMNGKIASRWGYILEINRLYDMDGKGIGFGPRPGSLSLDEQIESLSTFVGSNDVILVEDGISSGNTIVSLLQRFKTNSMSVSTIIVGFASPEAVKVIEQVFDGQIVVIEKITKHVIDWMPDHDFIPFSPNCGRVLGVYIGGRAYPVYTQNGVALSFPYVHPFGNLESWGSIPRDYANEFSLYCVQTAMNLFSLIEVMNGGIRLGIRDVLGTNPMICLPVSLGVGDFPSLDIPIVEYLGSVCHKLFLTT